MAEPVVKIDAKGKVKKIQVVSFLVNEMNYAIDIDRIHEIIYFKKATPLPQAPSFIEGVLDLRGTVVPIIDLKKKMGMTSDITTPSSHILIVKLHNNILGVIVDEVKEVLHLDMNQVQAPQKIHKGSGSRYLTGVCKVGERLVFLLDLDALLTGDEQTSLGEM